MAISEIQTRTTGKLRKGPPCSVCQLLDQLNGPEAQALTDLLSDPTVRYSWLSRELATEGHDLGAYVLARHARGDCAAGTKLR